jgi:hypothetical protein
MKMFCEFSTQRPQAALCVVAGSWNTALTEKGAGATGEGW